MAVEVSPQRRKEIIERLKKGDSPKEVRDAFGIPHQTLAKIRREVGLLAPTKAAKRSAPPRRAQSLSLDDVRRNVETVIEGLEAEKQEHLSRVKELDAELEHARKILRTMS